MLSAGEQAAADAGHFFKIELFWKEQ